MCYASNSTDILTFLGHKNPFPHIHICSVCYCLSEGHWNIYKHNCSQKHAIHIPIGLQTFRFVSCHKINGPFVHWIFFIPLWHNIFQILSASEIQGPAG